MGPLLVILLAAVALSACGGPEPDFTYRRFDVFLNGHPKPIGFEIVIDLLLASAPAGGRAPQYGGTIRIENLPFDCGGMKVWGCSDPFSAGPEVRVGYTKTVVEGALIEELGHWMWSPVCGPCEQWTATGGARDARFESWVKDRRAEAIVAVAQEGIAS